MNHPNWSGYRIAAWIGLLLIAAGVGYSVMQGRWVGIVLIASTMVVGVAFLLMGDKIPSLFDLILVIALVATTTNEIWRLYSKLPWLDEIMHFYGGFAITLPVGWLVRHRLMSRFHRPISFVLAVVGIGFLIGLLWEFAEWTGDAIVSKSNLLKGPVDTLTDLILDIAGAFIAGVVILKTAGKSYGRDWGNQEKI